MNIRREGVWQGCYVPLLLFHIYSEQIFKEASEGIKINRERINNIKYAVDTVIVATDCNELQKLCKEYNIASQDYGLELNTAKNKYMLIDKTEPPTIRVIINNRNIEQVDTYFGTAVNSKENKLKKFVTHSTTPKSGS